MYTTPTRMVREYRTQKKKIMRHRKKTEKEPATSIGTQPLLPEKNEIAVSVFVFTYVFLTLIVLKSQFAENGFEKTEHLEQNVVSLSFLFMLDKRTR